MNHRDQILEQFSTFIDWNQDRFGHWLTDPKLARHQKHYLTLYPDYTSILWVSFWHHHRQQLPPEAKLATDHLYAYLQEPLYRSSYKLWMQHREQIDLTLPDLFGFGQLMVPKLLDTFNPRINPNLEAHGKIFLRWRLQDKLRSLKLSQGQTLWGILLNVSEIQLRKALIDYGLSSDLLEAHLQAWECYCVAYGPVKEIRDGKIQAPNSQQWDATLQLYPAEQLLIPDLTQLKQWIETCGQALYNINSISIDTLNRPVGDEDGQEWLDLIAASDLSPLDDIMHQDFHEKILAWVKEQWESLDLKAHRLNPHTRTIHQQAYGDREEQQAIADALGINQSTVSRNINAVKKIFCEQFMAWISETMHMELIEDDIETIQPAMTVWISTLFRP